jgi:hypothetical protein
MLALLALVALALAGCGSSAPSASSVRARGADLSIQVNFPSPSTSTYECLPSGASGSVRSCSSSDLSDLAAALSPALEEKAQSCAQQEYVGPQVAYVTGYLRGRRVSTRLTRQNACGASDYASALRLLALPVPSGS